MESIKLLPIMWDGPCGMAFDLLGIVWWSRPLLIKHLWIGWGGRKWALWALLALESLVVITLLKSTRRAFGASNLWSVSEGYLLPSHFLLLEPFSNLVLIFLILSLFKQPAFLYSLKSPIILRDSFGDIRYRNPGCFRDRQVTIKLIVSYGLHVMHLIQT